MIDVIVCASSNLFRMYLIYRFIKVFLGEVKQDRVKEIVCYGLFWLINTGLFLTFHLVWVNILCNLTGIALLVRMYTKSWKSILFVSVSINIINMACDCFVAFMVLPYEDGKAYSQIFGVIGIFLIFICELLVEKIILDRGNENSAYHMSLICVPICSITLIGVLIYTKSSTYKGISITGLSLLLINFFMFYFYSLFLKMIKQKYELEELKYKQEAYANQIQVMLESREKVNSLRHDLKHHINELKMMVAGQQFPEMKSYIQDMETFLGNRNEFVESGNMEVDSILNYMLQKADEKCLKVEVKTVVPERMRHSFDMNVIIGNLLENAIEAATQTKERYLGIQIQFRKGIFIIEIENSFLEEQLKQDLKGNFLTSKKEKCGHGIGIQNVRKVVEKSNGSMEIKQKGSHFIVKILLYVE